MGRAVLIGTVTYGLSGKDTCTVDNGYDYYVRVSRYLDWIIGVTQLDSDHLKSSGHKTYFTDLFNEYSDQYIREKFLN